MKDEIKNFILIASGLVLAGAFFVTPVKAQASVDLNSYSNEGIAVLSAKDNTQNPDSINYQKTVNNVNAGDVLKLQFHYHNFTPTEAAKNVRMSIQVPSGASRSFTINGALAADNARVAVNDSVTLNLTSDQTLTFVSGSVAWFPEFAGPTPLPNGQTGDSIISSGVSVGDVQFGNSKSGYIYLRLMVGNNNPNPGSVPSANTDSAINVSDNSATLNGSVNPNGASTNYYFEYGTSNSFGNTTSSNSAGSANASQNVSQVLSGLNSNSTYYYRVVAQNQFGISRGTTMSFTTSNNFSQQGSAPSADTVSATSIGDYYATLMGSINPHGFSTDYWFEYGTSQGNLVYSTSQQPIGNGNSSLNVSRYVSNLNSNTTYYYRVVARNSFGTTYGGVLALNTTGNGGGGTISGCSSPLITSSYAGFNTDNSASLRGVVNPNGANTDAWFEYGTSYSLGLRTSYQTFYGYSTGYSGQDLIRYVSNLQPNTNYYFRAVGQSSCGTSYGNILNFSTTGTTNLPVVNTLLATNIGSTYATLNGEVNPRNSNSAVSWFEYGTDQNLNNYSVTSSANTGYGDYMRSMSAPISNLSSNTNYYFRAVIRNDAGTNKGAILTFRTGGSSQSANTSSGSATLLSALKEVKNLTFPNGTQFVNVASIGDAIEYSLSVKNVGNSTANDIVVKDTVSPYYDIVEASPNFSSSGANGLGQQLIWNLGSLGADQDRVITLRVKAKTVEQSVVVYNSFSASSNGASWFSNKTTTILNPSMMAMDISADKNAVDRNGTFNYSIRYRNIGINDVDNAVIKLSMPEGVKFISSSPGFSSSDANVYFYRIGRVAKNQQGVISIQAQVPEDAESGSRQIATAVLDYSDIFGTPQRNISSSAAIDVGTGLAALAAAVGFSYSGNWLAYLLWSMIILLVMGIAYLYFKISRILKNNY